MARTSKKTVSKTDELVIAAAAVVAQTQVLDLDDLVGQIDVAILETLPAEPEIQIETSLTEEDLHILDAKSIALESQAPEAPDMGQIIEIATAPEEVQPFVFNEAERPQMPAFESVMEMFGTERREEMRANLVLSLDAREEYEVFEKSNDNILKSLRKSRERLCNVAVAAVFLATNVDPQVFNRHKMSTNRYNVYAIDKVRDFVVALASNVAGVTISNAVNRAVVASMIKFRQAGIGFTMETAKDATSDKRRVSAVFSKHLVRHTVSASTASTQASSTMSALETLGFVTKSGVGKSAVYALTDTPQTRKLEELMGA